ncbi:MAG: TetR/AcrR family transcriptional regulator, partial [Cyclobacteriaceae bacterium]|nr:TetR/AcrR family transcriptional regulator [Cyclobacteriaceae bacterium]
MEKTKKTRGKSAPINKKILDAYREFVVTEGKTPGSVFAFCKSIGIAEGDFYRHFASFEAIEKSVWKNLIDTTIARMEADGDYNTFGAREKILTFYFMLAEALKADRSFVLYQLKGWKQPLLPGFLKSFKVAFDAWINSVLNAAKGAGEIASRPYLDQRYDALFWMHFLFILQFWAHDESANFEKTDAAIEKSVNLAFDLIGKGILDNALDFGKFLYQNARN